LFDDWKRKNRNEQADLRSNEDSNEYIVDGSEYGSQQGLYSDDEISDGDLLFDENGPDEVGSDEVSSEAEITEEQSFT
jgi:hypothetical protein